MQLESCASKPDTQQVAEATHLFLMQQPKLEKVLKVGVRHGAYCIELAASELGLLPIEPDRKQPLGEQGLL